ncbi:MAG: TetR/AcrR family transcriptional regulator [Rickettsiales bacterium]
MAPRSKREDILHKAGELFVKEGYRKVTMDQIAEAVPVSKPTLYSNFADKAALFSAVIEDRCQKLIAGIRSGVDAKMSAEEALREIGRQFLEKVVSEQALSMHRIIAAESEDFPNVARLFYESGPKQMHLLLSKYLTTLQQQKILDVKDPSVSADMFLSMLKGHLHLRCMMGVQAAPTKAEIKKRVDYAVDLFMKAHAL